MLVRPLAEKEYNTFKKCSQKNCRKEFDELIKVTGKNFNKDMKKVNNVLVKTIPKLRKKYNVIEGKLPSKSIRNKIGKEINEEVKKIYKPYEKIQNAFKDCHQKNCK